MESGILVFAVVVAILFAVGLVVSLAWVAWLCVRMFSGLGHTAARAVVGPNRKLTELVLELGDWSTCKPAMDRLVALGSEAVPGLLDALEVPRGQAHELIDEEKDPKFWQRRRGTAWDGDLVRRLSAEALGRLRAPEALDGLVSVLDDSDRLLAAKAVWALGEIGDVRAIPALIPYLGDCSEKAVFWNSDKEPFNMSGIAGETLRTLGQGSLVDAFTSAMQGETGACVAMERSFHREVIAALLQALDTAPPHGCAFAARTLAALGAIEALPKLRSLARAASLRVRVACESAIVELEKKQSLPVPVSGDIADATTLPRQARESEASSDTLPRVQTNQ